MKPSFIVRNDHDGREVFYGYKLWGQGKDELSIRLHKFISADDKRCYHTHPAKGIRIVLWGGYEEEVIVAETNTFSDGPISEFREIRPGFIGWITPEFEHRIERLLNGKASWSLFIRWPYTHKITTRGC